MRVRSGSEPTSPSGSTVAQFRVVDCANAISPLRPRRSGHVGRGPRRPASGRPIHVEPHTLGAGAPDAQAQERLAGLDHRRAAVAAVAGQAVAVLAVVEQRQRLGIAAAALDLDRHGPVGDPPVEPGDRGDQRQRAVRPPRGRAAGRGSTGRRAVTAATATCTGASPVELRRTTSARAPGPRRSGPAWFRSRRCRPRRRRGSTSAAFTSGGAISVTPSCEPPSTSSESTAVAAGRHRRDPLRQQLVRPRRGGGRRLGGRAARGRRGRAVLARSVAASRSR